MNIYLLKQKYYDTANKELPRWVIVFDAVAFFCFWVAHWLYVSTFLKVVIKAPEVFGEKTNDSRKTTCAVTAIIIIDYILYLAIFACMVWRMINATTLSSNYAQTYW